MASCGITGHGLIRKKVKFLLKVRAKVRIRAFLGFGVVKQKDSKTKG